MRTHFKNCLWVSLGHNLLAEQYVTVATRCEPNIHSTELNKGERRSPASHGTLQLQSAVCRRTFINHAHRQVARQC